jgi:ribosomal-protein-alanine N-acetyltransferase
MFRQPRGDALLEPTSLHKRIETERAVRNFIDCTLSYYRFWAVAAAETDRCLGLVNYHDGSIRSKRASIGYIIDPTRQRQGMATEAVAAMLDSCFGDLGLHRVQAFVHLATSRQLHWLRSSDSVAKACCATTCAQ